MMCLTKKTTGNCKTDALQTESRNRLKNAHMKGDTTHEKRRFKKR